MKDLKCEHCDNTFNNEKVLAKHKLDNHRGKLTSHERDELKRILKSSGKQSSQNFNKNLLIIPVILILVFGAVFFVLSPTGDIVSEENKTETENMEEFTKCLNETSVMYAQTGCGACETQKQMFGDNIKYLDVVYCDEKVQLCQSLEIRRTPTWIIQGQRYIGVQSLEELSDISLCGLP